MVKWLRWNRSVRVVIAVLFLPIVFISTAPAAQAASSNEGQQFVFEVGGVGPIETFPDFVCNLGVSLTAATDIAGDDGYTATVGTSYCVGYVNMGPFCGQFEWDCTSYFYSLLDSSGSTCLDFVLSDSAYEADGMMNVGVQLSGSSTAGTFGSVAGVAPVTCDPVTACLEYAHDGGATGGDGEKLCQPTRLDPPGAGHECPGGGSMGQPEITLGTRVTNSEYGWREFQLLGNGEAVMSMPPDVTNNTGWVWYAVLGATRDLYPGDWQVRGGSSSSQKLWVNATGKNGTPGSTLNADGWDSRWFNSMDGAGREQDLQDMRIVGVGGAQVIGGNSGALVSGLPSQANDVRAIGMNDPSQCRFYWGEKILDFPGTDVDEPLGDYVPPGEDGTEDGDVEPPPATPVQTDDNSLLAGILGLLARILSAMWSLVKAVGSLAAKIAQAIADALAGLVDAVLDGVRALFVPDNGFFDAQFDRLDGAFDQTSPGKYMDSVDQLVPSASSGGCSGPTFDVTIKGKQLTSQPFSTCSGAVAGLAATCRLMLTVGLVVFGGLACVRAVGSGLGWSPGIGGRE